MSFKLKNNQHIHFVGIGGSGMSGIAEVLLTRGLKITGSDMSSSTVTEGLEKLGATIYFKHEASNVGTPDAVVYSSAITPNNPELVTARDKNIPVLARAEILAVLMDTYFGIAIAGTHGKTTTTSLISSVLAGAGYDPTFVIGGLLKSAGTNARLGQGKYFVAEADESDASFLHLHPKMIVITNIDADHLVTYGGDYRRLQAAFVAFTNNLPESGVKVVCIDDPGIAEILPQIKGKVITYGFSPEADVQAIGFQQQGLYATFQVVDHRVKQTLNMKLHLAGRHNVLNSLAAFIVSTEIGVEKPDIQNALLDFQGVGRRFQILGKFSVNEGSALIVDDYGHHPKEVAATMAAARQVWPDRRLVMAYQPHRYTRTQELWDDFVKVLSEPDQLLLCDIYSAGENPIEGITGQSLFEAISKVTTLKPIYVADVADLQKALQSVLIEDDIVLIQGAGSIGKMASKLHLTPQ